MEGLAAMSSWKHAKGVLCHTNPPIHLYQPLQKQQKTHAIVPLFRSKQTSCIINVTLTQMWKIFISIKPDDNFGKKKSAFRGEP
jgi:hypothetical protein